jgi:hypothetical protein
MLDMLSKLRTWHERQIFGFQDAMRLDDYHMMWFAFGKGVLFTALFVWLCG